MTIEDWLDSADYESLVLELSAYTHRKLHLLTAAFLRRVYDRLPSEHCRRALKATEMFADGLISADALAWTRSQAAREAGDTFWLPWDADQNPYDYQLIDPCPCCSDRNPAFVRHECRVAKQGGVIDGVRAGIEKPAAVAASTAFHVTSLENPALFTAGAFGSVEWRWEWQSLFATVREVLGETGTADWLPPAWLSSDVVALARGIHIDQDFDRLPILADALQDAGCDDESILWHSRRPGGHIRGCWAVDLARGVS
ncbi:hypothetical protein R5W23_006014 [Gemmata sp. JC673]|uniref:SMI1/KNR4 family protein n=1 Tax=Gemmata algarum TaxID=2975278 RepID=A0ABU5ESI1_9BACT|nr:hypothetical protein [Gemmata algarum]MDY3557914.1 hypothetical protein [Gemmata algarum]